jgi:hypothetical protein
MGYFFAYYLAMLYLLKLFLFSLNEVFPDLDDFLRGAFIRLLNAFFVNSMNIFYCNFEEICLEIVNSLNVDFW